MLWCMLDFCWCCVFYVCGDLFAVLFGLWFVFDVYALGFGYCVSSGAYYCLLVLFGVVLLFGVV